VLAGLYDAQCQLWVDLQDLPDASDLIFDPAALLRTRRMERLDSDMHSATGPPLVPYAAHHAADQEDRHVAGLAARQGAELGDAREQLVTWVAAARERVEIWQQGDAAVARSGPVPR